MKIIEKIAKITSYEVDFEPCCKDWENEFGHLVSVIADGSGIVPGNVVINYRTVNRVTQKSLKIAWRVCPFCHKSLECDIIEAK